MLHSLRPRADYAHIAFQDIDELRKFVQTGLPDKFTDRSDPLVILRRRNDLSFFFRILDHTAELMDGEHFPVDRASVLTEKDPGPPSYSLIAAAMMSMIGEVMISASDAMMISISLLTNFSSKLNP